MHHYLNLGDTQRRKPLLSAAEYAMIFQIPKRQSRIPAINLVDLTNLIAGGITFIDYFLKAEKAVAFYINVESTLNHFFSGI